MLFFQNLKSIIPNAQLLADKQCWPSETSVYNVCMNIPFDPTVDGAIGEVKFFINGFIGLAGLVAVILLVYGGITFILSTGDAEKVEKGQKIVVSAIVGLIVVFLASIIVNTVLSEVFVVK